MKESKFPEGNVASPRLCGIAGQADQLLKAHVSGYTTKNGTAVAPHEDKRPAAPTKIKPKGGHLGGGAGLWRAGHMVRVNIPGHELHGFSGEVTGAQHDGYHTFLKIRGKDKELAINVHDLIPAEGHGWPDLDDDYSQKIKKPKGGGTMAKALLSELEDLTKAHVDQFTKKDGTVVKEHETKVPAAAAPVQHGVVTSHKDAAGAAGNVAARRADLESKGFKHQKSEKHAFGENHHFSHEDGSRAVVSQVAPDATDKVSQHKVNSLINAMNKGKKAGAGGAASPSKPGGMPSDKQLDQMESTLANDEESSDEEMVEFFVKECGIDPEHAKAAVAVRSKFMTTAIPPQGMLKELMEKGAKGEAGEKPKPAATKPDPAVAKARKADSSSKLAVKEHPNFHPDDYAALKDKGYDDDQIKAIWDQDTARNGGQPTGGNSREDLKLPTQEHPDGQPGSAAKAADVQTAEQTAGAVKPEKKAALPDHWMAAHDHAEDTGYKAWNGPDATHEDAAAAFHHSANLHSGAAKAAEDAGDMAAATEHTAKAAAHKAKARSHQTMVKQKAKGGDAQPMLFKAQPKE